MSLLELIDDIDFNGRDWLTQDRVGQDEGWKHRETYLISSSIGGSMYVKITQDVRRMAATFTILKSQSRQPLNT